MSVGTNSARRSSGKVCIETHSRELSGFHSL